MRNILSLHIETKVSLAIMGIVIAISLVAILKSLDNFKDFTDKMDKEMSQYEEVRIKKGP